jgi:hypothetical protein
MARQKIEKNSTLSKGKVRLSALESISATLDLGNGYTLALYKSEIDKMEQIISNYNTALSTLDNLYYQLKEQDDKLKELNEQMLLSVASKYTKNSTEYEMAGGTRKSDRKKPIKKLKTV